MEPSGYTFENQVVAVLLRALDGLMGTNGLHSLLNASGLKTWIDSPPPLNADREIDFSDVSNLFMSIEDLYGQKGAQSLLRPAQATVFEQVIAQYAHLKQTDQPEFLALDDGSRLEQGFTLLAEALTDSSDIQANVDATGNGIHFILKNCPICHGRKKDKQGCYGLYGLLEAASRKFAPDLKVTITESDCIAMGKDHCQFEIQSSP
jgi:predicted hydrocarbon binding protein